MVVDPNAQKVFSTDPWADLLEHGYIDPEELLQEGAEEVLEAMAILNEFIELLQEEDVLRLV